MLRFRASWEPTLPRTVPRASNEVMKDNPDMEIVACQVADFDRAKGMSVMENILQANPEIDGLYAANDEMLLGALEAMEAAGRTDEIVKSAVTPSTTHWTQ